MTNLVPSEKEFDARIALISDSMSKEGLSFDTASAESKLETLSVKADALEEFLVAKIAAALSLPSHSVDLNSSKTMISYLFGYLGLPCSRTTPKGQPSLDAASLEELVHFNDDVAKYSEWRSLSRRISLLKNLIKDVNPQTGRIHSHFDPKGAISGRFTSSGPNLQQIPEEFKNLFFAEGNTVFISIDLCQAEYALACIGAGVPVPKDIHTETATRLNISRDKAKVFNLAIMYGIQAYGLSKQLKISQEQAESLILQWRKDNPALWSFILETNRNAKNSTSLSHPFSFVQTLLGRDIQFSYLKDDYRPFNLKMQGSCADVLKAGMIALDEEFSNVPAKIVLCVHDSVVVKISADYLKLHPEYYLRVKDIFAKAYFSLEATVKVSKFL